MRKDLAFILPDDLDRYTDVKGAACDLIYFAAEAWAQSTGWSAGPSDGEQPQEQQMPTPRRVRFRVHRRPGHASADGGRDDPGAAGVPRIVPRASADNIGRSAHS